MTNTEGIDIPINIGGVIACAHMLARSRSGQKMTRQDVSDALAEWAQQCSDPSFVNAVMEEWARMQHDAE